MNYKCLVTLLLCVFCIKSIAQIQKITSVKVDTLYQNSISIRAIVIDNNKVWFASNRNLFGYVDLATKRIFEQKIHQDTLHLEFRSIAQTTKSIFILNVGNPALLYKFSKLDYFPKSDFLSKIVYQETNSKVFYDSMQFYNETDGIAIGDPTENCLSIITTKDKGETWHKISCDKLPKVEDGEAAFAASNTNIIIKNNKTWVVSGGKKASVFYSSNKGNSWKTYGTPIIQGKTMTGIFTADFYDEKIGIIAGGDYENLTKNSENKAITKDGGKTWKLIAENRGFGYASCIQFVPKSKGKNIVYVGANGLFCSNDFGVSWTKLLDDTNLFTIRFVNENLAIAAGKNKIVKLYFK